MAEPKQEVSHAVEVQRKWERSQVGEVLTLERCALTALALAKEKYLDLLLHAQLLLLLSEHFVDAIADALCFKLSKEPAVAICRRLVWGRLERRPERIGHGSAAVWDERDVHHRCRRTTTSTRGGGEGERARRSEVRCGRQREEEVVGREAFPNWVSMDSRASLSLPNTVFVEWRYNSFRVRLSILTPSRLRPLVIPLKHIISPLSMTTLATRHITCSDKSNDLVRSHNTFPWLRTGDRVSRRPYVAVH